MSCGLPVKIASTDEAQSSTLPIYQHRSIVLCISEFLRGIDVTSINEAVLPELISIHLEMRETCMHLM
jgi:hypothetical protein